MVKKSCRVGEKRCGSPTLPKQTANCFCKLELFADAEFLDYVFVRLGIVALEVVEQTTASADHHEKTATGRVILLMGLKVFGQFADPFAQNCNLNLWATCIRRMRTVLADNALFSLAG